MIEVEGLRKRYGEVVAVAGISFRVAKGEIVGLLGPNGAGKSTTMKILTGFLPATEGTVKVAGFDVFTHSLEARRHLGYMPENVPLYPEMRPVEYLRFRAALKNLPRAQIRKRVDEVMERCWVTEKARALIGHLSKGYRQRVGLADALLGEPDLLVLDEPTIGLDPTQVLQLRQLIRSLGDRHTILLSSHILTEVEAVCSRVVIIHRGRIVADDRIDALKERLAREAPVDVELQAPASAAAAALSMLPGVRQALPPQALEGGWMRARLVVEAGRDPRADVLALARDRGWGLRELHRVSRSLEDVFVDAVLERGAAA